MPLPLEIFSNIIINVIEDGVLISNDPSQQDSLSTILSLLRTNKAVRRQTLHHIRGRPLYFLITNRGSCEIQSQWSPGCGDFFAKKLGSLPPIAWDRSIVRFDLSEDIKTNIMTSQKQLQASDTEDEEAVNEYVSARQAALDAVSTMRLYSSALSLTIWQILRKRHNQEIRTAPSRRQPPQYPILIDLTFDDSIPTTLTSCDPFRLPLWTFGMTHAILSPWRTWVLDCNVLRKITLPAELATVSAHVPGWIGPGEIGEPAKYANLLYDQVCEYWSERSRTLSRQVEFCEATDDNAWYCSAEWPRGQNARRDGQRTKLLRIATAAGKGAEGDGSIVQGPWIGEAWGAEPDTWGGTNYYDPPSDDD